MHEGPVGMSTLTIFTIPKAFKGHIGTIQRNAIQSWTKIEPRPEIWLLGKDEGTEEAAKEFGVGYIAEIATNGYGTPLMSDIFRQAEMRAHGEILCYVNADIIVMNDFARALERVAKKLKKFLVIAERINLDITERLGFEPGWDAILKKMMRDQGTFTGPTGIDIFAFPKGTYRQVPNFAIGRLWFDQWLIKGARKQHIPVVDVSRVAPLLHQNHDYNHVSGGADQVWKGKEAEENFAFYGSQPHTYTILSANYVLNPSGRLKRVFWRQERLRVKNFFWKIFVQKTARVRKRLGLTSGARA
jgi:hypothetical protein